MPQTQSFTVQQTGPSGTISIGTPNCNGDGASATDGPQTVAISPNAGPTTINVTAQAAPTQSPPPTHACTIAITGGGGQTATVTVDIHVTSIGITGHRSATPAPTPSPSPAPPMRKTH